MKEKNGEKKGVTLLGLGIHNRTLVYFVGVWVVDYFSFASISRSS